MYCGNNQVHSWQILTILTSHAILHAIDWLPSHICMRHFQWGTLSTSSTWHQSSIFFCLRLKSICYMWWMFNFSATSIGATMNSGVTRGGRGGRVTHPWKVCGEILERRGMRKRGREGEKRRKGKMERKRREWGKLEMEGERYENEQRTFVWGCGVCVECGWGVGVCVWGVGVCVCVLLVTFWNHWIFWRVPKWKFLRGKIGKWEIF